MPFKLGCIHTETPAAVPGLAGVMRIQATHPVDSDWISAYPPNGDALGNDKFSCCVVAAKYEAVAMRRANAWGDSWRPTEAVVVADYQRLNPAFDPVTGAGDDGLRTDEAMADWASHGVRTDEQNEDVPLWIGVPRRSLLQIKLAMAHFGPLQMTFLLPAFLQEDPLQPWKLPRGTPGLDAAPGSLGAHRVCAGRIENGKVTVRSWGNDIEIDWDFFVMYIAAVDVTLSRQWINAAGTAPSGWSYDRLAHDLGRTG
jgi:hypothetical protein